MLFSVIPHRVNLPSSANEQAFLIRDNWDDWFEFETTFQLVVFDRDGKHYELGAVKIGQFEMTTRSPTIPESFDKLGAEFFSLGQTENYYETFYALGSFGERILKDLRDVATDLHLFAKARGQRVMGRSLLRYVDEDRVRHRFHLLAKGSADPSAFNFTYEFPLREGADTLPLSLSFKVTPESLPPTNIHVLIGRNGVGKTTCLSNMTRSVVEVREHSEKSKKVGVFKRLDGDSANLLTNLVSVTFSAFDLFGPLPLPHAVPYSYIGLKRRSEPKNAQTSEPKNAQTSAPVVDAQSSASTSGDKSLPPMTPDELAEEFVASVGMCRTGARAPRWRKALETLEADPLFQAADVASLASNDDDFEGDPANDEGGSGWEERARRLYKRLSSGHKIVLLTITRLVETVDERTLVLLDEPEAHLHPPLLAAFVRALSDLLMQRNGVAIIATHSPVVLQEAPRTCVWILQRSGLVAVAERPTLETFGENVGILTREVFGLEVTRSGFHKLLEDVINKTGGGYEDIVKRFDNQLGAEARIILRGLLAARSAEQIENA